MYWKIRKRLIVSMLASAVAIIVLLTVIQTLNSHVTTQKSAVEKLVAVKNTIEANNENIERLTQNVGDNNLAKTRALAEIIAADPSLLEKTGYLAELSKKLDASCICVIDGNGIITHSDNPAYVGFDMGSSDQSKVFNDILRNPSLEIVQEPMQNGTSGEIFQYIGVARKDAPGYLQIELKPTVLQETLAATSIDVVLGRLDFEGTGYVFAIDNETGLIAACKNSKLIGLKATDNGFKVDMTGKGTVKIDNVGSWYYGEKYGDYTIGVLYPNSDYNKSSVTMAILISVSMILINSVLLFVTLDFIKKQVIVGINNINASVAEISDGNLEAKVNETSQTEFVVLGDAINSMVNNIKNSVRVNDDLLKKQQKDMEESLKLFDDVKAVCMNLENISKEILKTASYISTGNGDQQSTVEDLHKRMTILSDKLNENSSEASNIAEINMKAVNNLINARKQFDELSSSMNNITETSKAIETIISEIDEIASQTNLLALNASIEAARAGESGRGFAVVATEIGQLANRSSEASRETHNLIQDAVSAVEKGNEIKDKAVTIFTEAVERMQSTSRAVQDMSDSANNHVKLVKEAEESLSRIMEVVEQNAAVANESEAVAANMADETAKLYRMVEAG